MIIKCVCVQASGVKVDNDCKTIFQDVKMDRKHRYVLFGFGRKSDNSVDEEKITVLKKVDPGNCY